MKKLLLILPFLLSSSLLGDELSWVDEQVKAIKPPRNGMSASQLKYAKSPFIFLAKNRPESKASKSAPSGAKSKSITPSTTNSDAAIAPTGKKVQVLFSLGLLMNNKALINGEWYSLGDKINGYTVQELDHKSVLLVKGKKKISLSTRSNSKNLNFNNK